MNGHASEILFCVWLRTSGEKVETLFVSLNGNMEHTQKSRPRNTTAVTKIVGLTEKSYNPRDMSPGLYTILGTRPRVCITEKNILWVNLAKECFSECEFVCKASTSCVVCLLALYTSHPLTIQNCKEKQP